MLYQSTRGEKKTLTAAEAIARGIAEDGGLFVPDAFPRLDPAGLLPLGYRARAERVLAPFLTGFTAEEVAQCTAGAYTAEKFESDDIAPVRSLDGATHILELFHGPTAAFKDVALQILPHFMTAASRKLGGQDVIRILVATSGDTGKAAMEGFADVPGTEILVFYPSDGVSDIQKLQMRSQTGGNVGVCGIRGNFDDAQTGVKRVFGDPAIRAALKERGIVFSSANSINVGRLIPQIVYYYSAYCDLVNRGAVRPGEPVNIAVPTGNFGNILAAYYAMRMGLPVNRLICASNRNNVLTDFIRTGVYDRNRPFYQTESPSMDILVSSNLERYLHALGGVELTRACMDALRKDGRYRIPDALLAEMDKLFWGGFCDSDATCAEIARCWNESRYLLDPHTAVASGVLRQYRAETGDMTPAVVASTASPYKFADSVLAALGTESEGFDAIDRLAELTGVAVPKPIAALRGRPVLHERVCDVAELPEVAQLPIREV